MNNLARLGKFCYLSMKATLNLRYQGNSNRRKHE
jgi:hypothetical protein